MNTVTKLSGFLLGLAAVFGAAYGVGQLVGPVTSSAGTGHGSDTGHAASDHSVTTDAHATGGAHLPDGLLTSQDGYTLTPVPSSPEEFAFRITGPDGSTVTAFDIEHEQRMHLIVVRRDLSGFRHVHPQMDPDGVWRTPSPFEEPGVYRVFADFHPTGGAPLTLGTDVSIAGMYYPQPLPPPAPTSTVDGYTVTLDGALEPGHSGTLTLSVTRDGVPVTDLEPYLGAYGHLVALRAGDLAYLHVHPEGAVGDGQTNPGPDLRFTIEVPTAGTYRLYLDFQHAGVVRTAEFTLMVGSTSSGNSSGNSSGTPSGTPAADNTTGADDATGADHTHGTPAHTH